MKKIRKQELYRLTEAHRPKEKTFKIDAILKAFDHAPHPLYVQSECY